MNNEDIIFGNNFTLNLINKRHVIKYNCEMSNYSVKFRNIPADLIESTDVLLKIFDEIVQKLIQKASKEDRIKLYIDHPSLTHPISLPFIRADQLTSDMILNYIQKVVQSNKILTLDNRLMVYTTILFRPFGAGGSARGIKCVNKTIQSLLSKQCVVRILNENDNMCALKAVVVAKAYVDKSILYSTIRDHRNRMQTDMAIQLATAAKIAIDKPCGVEEIKKIQYYLSDYQIYVIDANSLYDFVFIGDNEKEKKIFLLYYNHHYDVIKTLPKFFNCKYFCFKCLKAYSCDKANHPCNEVCKKCKNVLCIADFECKIKCEFCGVMCKNPKCLSLHKLNVCGKVKKCDKCGCFKTFRHCCDGKWCKFCDKEVEIDHKCFILREDEKKKKEICCNGYIFFDYEAMQIDNVHIPNLIVARKVCFECLIGNMCAFQCGEFVWNHNDHFCDWMFDEQNKDFIAVAHNMKGYDGYFIMQYIVKNLKPNERMPDCVLNGSKLLVIKFRNIKIIDSFNFIPLALSKLPKSFGIQEIKKGYFPHFFNIPINQNYIGEYPAKEYYGCEYMNASEYSKFIDWYEDQKDKVFDFKKEILEYCKSDVDILYKSCLKFRKLFMEITKINDKDNGVDPFLNCLTIASTCHFVYRRNFMPSKSIALIPAFGYHSHDKQSHKAILWLKYKSIKKSIYIQHAKNGYEKRIGQYKLDGWCEENQTVYEFHGCFFHGCQMCYTYSTFNTLTNECMGYTYEKHLKRIDYIKKHCLNYEEIWECDFDRLCLEDDVMTQIIANEKDFRAPLNPRDALSGGRTNASILYYEGPSGYVDFTSLYPYVQKYGVFPIGHPKIITENFGNVLQYFGLIFCKVLPPNNLLFPVLPYKHDGKLLFPLCFTCAKLKCNFCEHNDDERALEGTWVTLEMHEAIKRGYKIIKIFEVWHWHEKDQYDPDTQKGGLFTNYVNTFLRIKQEASGYPGDIIDKEKYIEDYIQHEGIHLQKENIKENPGLKSISKLMLNSQWGRYAMQTKKTQCKFIKSMLELTALLENKQYEIHDLNFPTDEIGIIYYQEKEEMHWGSDQTNVVLAAFVTCQARLKLFYEIEKLDKRVLYFDTDSIIYKKQPNEYEPKTGIFLGEFTNEIDPKEGQYISQFASAGPKNYSFRLDSGITHTKVKGFTLNVTASKKIDFEKIKSFVINKNEKETEIVTQSNIVRYKKDWTLKTRNTEKIYRLVYDKRIILDDLSTIPFGYKL